MVGDGRKRVVRRYGGLGVLAEAAHAAVKTLYSFFNTVVLGNLFVRHDWPSAESRCRLDLVVVELDCCKLILKFKVYGAYGGF